MKAATPQSHHHSLCQHRDEFSWERRSCRSQLERKGEKMGMFGSISSVCCSPTSTEQVILSTTGGPSPSLHIIPTAWWWFQCIFFLVMNFLLHLSLVQLQGNTRSYRDFIWEVSCNFSESFHPEKGLGFSQKLFRASSFLQSIWNSKFLVLRRMNIIESRRILEIKINLSLQVSKNIMSYNYIPQECLCKWHIGSC